MDCERRVEKLLRIIERVANGEYQRDNWRRILNDVAELFNADGAAIGEIRNEYIYYTKVSESITKMIPDYDPEKFKVPLWRSAAGEAIRRGYIIVNDYQNFSKAVENWKRAGLKRSLIAIIGKDGNPIGCLSVGRIYKEEPFTEEDGKILKSLAFILSFIVREEIEKRELIEKAIKDHLTKLYNRLYLEEESVREIEKAKRYGYPISLIMFDLDDFKKVNDRFGHNRGDEVLVKFADILRSKIRGTDIPVRFGGEEFVVLLPHASTEEAIKVAERIREEFERTLFRFDSEVIKLTVSAGVSSCEPSEECGLEKLLYKADKALYEAKRSGKNRVESLSQRV